MKIVLYFIDCKDFLSTSLNLICPDLYSGVEVPYTS